MVEDTTDRTEEKRLKILEPDEIDILYGLPVFDEEDRAGYFSLTPEERVLLARLHGVKSRVYFILQLGYFKARQQFFVFNLQQVGRDAHYVQRTYFPDETLTDLAITKVTRLRQQALILELLQYRACGDEERQQLRVKAQQVTRISSRPIYVFRELMAHLSRQHLVAPGYTVIQNLIGDVLQREKERLITIAQSQLTKVDVATLQSLLDNPRGLFEITRLKHEPKDFRNIEIKREIQRGEQIKSLYTVAQHILPYLDISNESIKYYASTHKLLLRFPDEPAREEFGPHLPAVLCLSSLPETARQPDQLLRLPG